MSAKVPSVVAPPKVHISNACKCNMSHVAMLYLSVQARVRSRSRLVHLRAGSLHAKLRASHLEPASGRAVAKLSIPSSSGQSLSSDCPLLASIAVSPPWTSGRNGLELGQPADQLLLPLPSSTMCQVQGIAQDITQVIGNTPLVYLNRLTEVRCLFLVTTKT